MKKYALVLVAALAVVLMTAGFAPGNGAIVVNRPDGLVCDFVVAGGFYVGPATLVETPQGRVNGHCTARLVEGTPVAKALRVQITFDETPVGPLTCNIQLTPSGNANLTCHR